MRMRDGLIRGDDLVPFEVMDAEQAAFERTVCAGTHIRGIEFTDDAGREGIVMVVNEGTRWRDFLSDDGKILVQYFDASATERVHRPCLDYKIDGEWRTYKAIVSE